jgi:integrase
MTTEERKADTRRKIQLGGLIANSYKRAYKTACAGAGVDFRLYDARHTFVTRLAENPTVSEETIRQLAGHGSPRMLARYAHIRAKARREAIATLEGSEPETSTNFVGGPTKSPTVVG